MAVTAYNHDRGTVVYIPLHLRSFVPWRGHHGHMSPNVTCNFMVLLLYQNAQYCYEHGMKASRPCMWSRGGVYFIKDQRRDLHAPYDFARDKECRIANGKGGATREEIHYASGFPKLGANWD